MKDCGSRLFRQELMLLEYNFKIIHRPGTLNRVANALNKMKCQAITRSKDQEIIPRDYIILVKTRTLLNLNKSDAIFSIISKSGGAIETKLKKKFPEVLLRSQWSQIDGKYFVKRFKWSGENTNEPNLEEICKFIERESTKNNMEEIAINVEFERPNNIFFPNST